MRNFAAATGRLLERLQAQVHVQAVFQRDVTSCLLMISYGKDLAPLRTDEASPFTASMPRARVEPIYVYVWDALKPS